jgi:hypothetical protein
MPIRMPACKQECRRAGVAGRMLDALFILSSFVELVSGLTLLLFFFAFIFLDAPTDTDLEHLQEVRYSLPRDVM